MTILSALGARALQTPSYPLGQQGNGKTSALSATQPAGGTASPVSLSDDGIDLQKRVEGLGGATIDLAQNLLNSFTQNLFGAAGKGATIAFDSASLDAESDFGVAAQQTSGPNGSTSSAVASLTDSSHFIGKGTITTADGRTFDFEIDVQYSDEFDAGVSESSGTSPSSTDNTGGPAGANSAGTLPDALAPADGNSNGTTVTTAPAQNGTASSDNSGLPTIQLPNIDFAGSLADLFKLIGQNLLDSIPQASTDSTSSDANAASSTANTAGTASTDASGSTTPSSSSSNLPNGLSLRLLKLVDSASQSDIYTPPANHVARAKSAADSYAAAAPTATTPATSADSGSAPAASEDSQSATVPAAAAAAAAAS